MNAVRREVVQGAGEGAEIVRTMGRVADERLGEEDLERLGELRVHVARARHRGADRRAGNALVEDGAE